MKAGDRILFGKSSGTEVKIDGEELLIMKNPPTSWGSSRAAPPREGGLRPHHQPCAPPTDQTKRE